MAYTTYDTAVAAYLANLDYDVDDDQTKAETFITACRSLRVLRPKRAGSGGSEIEVDTNEVKEELAKAEAWLRANSATYSTASSGSVRHLSFEEFRT